MLSKPEDRLLPWVQSKYAREPDATNDQGVQFWIDYPTQEYADSLGLQKTQCLFAVTPDGRESMIVVVDGCVVKESSSLEEIGCFLDFLKLSQS